MRGIPKWLALSCLLAGVSVAGVEAAPGDAPAEIAGRVIDAETGSRRPGRGRRGRSAER